MQLPIQAFRTLVLAALALPCVLAIAQTELPKVDVTAPKFEVHRRGYDVSSNFVVDPKMSAVIYPAEAFLKNDVIDVRPLRMEPDEYFVLQECSSLDCTQGHVLQVWVARGTLDTSRDPNRFWIPHDGKYFLWMQRFPMAGGGTFTGFKSFSPPLVLDPLGTAEQFQLCDVAAAQQRGPEKVVSTEHDDAQLKLHFASGSLVLIKRARPAD